MWLRTDGQESGAWMARSVTVQPVSGLTFALPARDAVVHATAEIHLDDSE